MMTMNLVDVDSELPPGRDGPLGFEIIYIEGTENILSDALSRLYSNDAVGTVHTPSEYTQHCDHSPPDAVDLNVTMPLLVGIEAAVMETRSRSGARPAWVPTPKQVYTHCPKNLAEPVSGDINT